MILHCNYDLDADAVTALRADYKLYKNVCTHKQLKEQRCNNAHTPPVDAFQTLQANMFAGVMKDRHSAAFSVLVLKARR